MSTIATLAVKLVGDITGYTKSMTDAEKQAQKTASQIGKTIQNAGKEITSLGKTATVGLTLPLVALGGYAINAASDLSETKNKIDVIFGGMSETIKTWSETSASSLGQSQQQALDAASNFAIFGQAAGLANQDLVKFSESNVQLASDLASFFNTSPEEAIQAIGAAYRGESEPIRKYGVLLSDAALQQQALQMGIIKELGPLTQQQRVLAANALILAQTSAAQGDFARTSDGLANSQRIMKAQLTDAAAALGQQLLPYALQFVQWVSGLITKFQQLTPEQQKWIVMIGAIVAAIGPVLTVVGSVVSAIGAIIPIVTAVAGAIGPVFAAIAAAVGVAAGPILIVIAVIVAAVALLYLAWRSNFLGIRDTVTTVFNAIKLIFQAFQAAFHGDWRLFGELLRQAWDLVWNLIQQRLNSAGNFIKTAIQNIIKGIQAAFHIDWGQLGRNIIDGIVNGLKAGVQWVKDAAHSVAEAAMDAVQGFLGIHSRSRLMFYFGQMTSLGFAQGMMSDNNLSIPKAMTASNGQVSVNLPKAAPTQAATPQHIEINIHNPKKETSEESLRKNLKSLSYLRVITS